MDTINIHQAKTHLSRLVDEAAKGKPFIIAKAGKPLVKVTAIQDAEAVAQERFGFLEGLIDVPDDFDDLGREEIEQMFSGEE